MARAVFVTISARNTMSDPGLLTCEAGDDFVIVVINDDDRDHKVWVDPGDVIFRHPRTSANPLSRRLHKIKVRAGRVGILKQRVKSRSRFFSRRAAGPHGSRIPYGRYKYTIRWADSGGRHSKKLDPDLEVSPPQG